MYVVFMTSNFRDFQQNEIAEIRDEVAKGWIAAGHCRQVDKKAFDAANEARRKTEPTRRVTIKLIRDFRNMQKDQIVEVDSKAAKKWIDEGYAKAFTAPPRDKAVKPGATSTK